jgi:hypothetical protein
MKGHYGLGLLERKSGGIGNSLFRRPTSRQFDGTAHPHLATHIIGKPDDITAKRLERLAAFIHCVDNILAGLGNLTPPLRLKFEKLIMFIKAFLQTGHP